MSTGGRADGLADEGSTAFRDATRLARAHATPAARTPAAAFVLARERFLEGQRIDMRALAGEIGISRPTLYRWTGPREQLLIDILSALSDASFRRAIRATADLTGPERLLAVFRHHVAAIVSSDPLQTFLRQEPQLALRILTSPHGDVNTRMASRLADFYRAEQARAGFRLAGDPDTLAFAVVCLTESFIYNDASAAVDPAVDRVASVVALLLDVRGTR